jgi:transcriptional regulator with GAF, ATPase, and Fis domain
MMDSLGQRPLGQIVSETARALEQLCIAEAMRRSDDNPEAAARLLGLPPEEVRRRARVQ